MSRRAAPLRRDAGRRPEAEADAIAALTDLAAPVVFFPVRHHSPAAARAVRALIEELRPAAVLVEGPSDFDEARVAAELRLPHRLPIAIYSYLRLADGRRRGAFYPFCVYSPEWQALQAALAAGIPARFIDLPWAALAADEEQPAQRYADGVLRRSDYVARLCRELGVEGFDALWDALVEQPCAATPPGEYLARVHRFCWHERCFDEEAGAVSAVDLKREAFMAAEVQRALERHGARLLVVTGGYHSGALWRRLQAGAAASEPAGPPARGEAAEEDRGLALTPYSYERLDALTGYEAGMPSPGFYHRVWLEREEGRAGDVGARLLLDVARSLREQHQAASSADLIAALTMAQGLASLRGREVIWRLDLLDGIRAALVKEELDQGCGHPFLAAVREVLRGHERGLLAEGTSLPPLLHDVQRLLEAHDLAPAERPRELELDLAGEAAASSPSAPPGGEDRPPPLTRSRLLHRLRVLGVSGFALVGGADLVGRDDLARVWERWRLEWSPQQDADCIAAAIYGSSLAEAAAARLAERSGEAGRDAERAALLLLDAALAGLAEPALAARLAAVVRGDGDFFNVSAALDHLLYLYRYDAVLGTAGLAPVGELLRETYERALWLLEGLGDPGGKGGELLRGARLVLETFERCGEALGLDRGALVAVLRRVAQDGAHCAAARGAALGALWTLGEAETALVLEAMGLFADPARLGDFLGGLFSLAREVAQRQPALVRSLDAVLLAFDEEEFLQALPALRLAFTSFTPREKHHLALTLLAASGEQGTEEPLAALQVPAAEAAAALAFERRVLEALTRFGLRQPGGAAARGPA